MEDLLPGVKRARDPVVGPQVQEARHELQGLHTHVDAHGVLTTAALQVAQRQYLYFFAPVKQVN